MLKSRITGWLRYWPLLGLPALGGCSLSNVWLFDPHGPLAAAQLHYMLIDVATMLVIVVPTALLAIWIAVRFRKSRGHGQYAPKWSHSNRIEVFVWGIPIITVGILSYFSIKGAYGLNPYNPAVIRQQVSASADPVEVDVITTDWRWLFVYPKYHIASVNELVVPVHTPVRFKLTSTSATNDIFIPQLVGMIDVMPGMRTEQALVADQPGTYAGYSTDYSGPGFSWMTFSARAVSMRQFKDWVNNAAQSPRQLTYGDFNKFAKPYIPTSNRPEYFSHVQGGLLDHVVNEVMHGKTWPTPMGMTENMAKYVREQNAKPTNG